MIVTGSSSLPRLLVLLPCSASRKYVLTLFATLATWICLYLLIDVYKFRSESWLRSHFRCWPLMIFATRFDRTSNKWLIPRKLFKNELLQKGDQFVLVRNCRTVARADEFLDIRISFLPMYHQLTEPNRQEQSTAYWVIEINFMQRSVVQYWMHGGVQNCIYMHVICSL